MRTGNVQALSARIPAAFMSAGQWPPCSGHIDQDDLRPADVLGRATAVGRCREPNLGRELPTTGAAAMQPAPSCLSGSHPVRSRFDVTVCTQLVITGYMTASVRCIEFDAFRRRNGVCLHRGPPDVRVPGCLGMTLSCAHRIVAARDNN